MKQARLSPARGIVCIAALTLASCVRLAEVRGRDTVVLPQSYGYLQAEQESAAFELVNDERILHVMAGPGKVLAPSGTYSLASWRVVAKHSGETWHIGGGGDYDEEPVEIRPGKTTVMAISLPVLRAGAVARNSGDFVLFRLTLTASDGRNFSSATIHRNGKRVEAPQVKILDARGEIVAVGQFEYG